MGTDLARKAIDGETDLNQEKKVTVVDRATGETRLASRAPLKPGNSATSDTAASTNAGGIEDSMGRPVNLSSTKSNSDGDSRHSQRTDQNAATTGKVKAEKATTRKGKKLEVDTLEQFIAHAYALKGRRVSITDAMERRIGREPKLDDEALARLSTIAQADTLFSVPRQLLLISHEIQTYPALRAAIRNFVKATMLASPLLAAEEIVGVIQNLPESLAIEEAINTVLEAAIPPGSNNAKKEGIKSSQIAELRANTAYCLAVWLHETRNVSLEEVTDALYRSLWTSSAKEVRDERAKLRTLTEVRDTAALGIACDEFRRIAGERSRRADAAQVTIDNAKSEINKLTDELQLLRQETAAQISSLEANVAETNARVEQLRVDAQHVETHLQDDLEELRTRVLRRLKADVSLLEEGLTALKRDPPKINVMVDHGERVTDALRVEIKRLDSGG